MNNDHEIALMYAPRSLGLFQPRMDFWYIQGTVLTPSTIGANLYSPFSDVVLRVIQPARPTLEDILFQLFASDNTPDQGDTEPLVQAQDPASDRSNSTPYDDLSERMAREMQEQEDREQAIREQAAALQTQFGGFMSSLFGDLQSGGDDLGPLFRDQHVNAEAGVSSSMIWLWVGANNSNYYSLLLPRNRRSKAHRDSV